MPKKSISEIMALGFQDGYEQAMQEFLQGHAEGFAAGFYQESEVSITDIKKGRVFELAFAEGFIAGNQAFQLSQTIDKYDSYFKDPIDEENAINLSEEFAGDDYDGEEGSTDDYPDIGDERKHDYLWMDT